MVYALIIALGLVAAFLLLPVFIYSITSGESKKGHWSWYIQKENIIPLISPVMMYLSSENYISNSIIGGDWFTPGVSGVAFCLLLINFIINTVSKSLLYKNKFALKLAGTVLPVLLLNVLYFMGWMNFWIVFFVSIVLMMFLGGYYISTLAQAECDSD